MLLKDLGFGKDLNNALTYERRRIAELTGRPEFQRTASSNRESGLVVPATTTTTSKGTRTTRSRSRSVSSESERAAAGPRRSPGRCAAGEVVISSPEKTAINPRTPVKVPKRTPSTAEEGNSGHRGFSAGPGSSSRTPPRRNLGSCLSRTPGRQPNSGFKSRVGERSGSARKKSSSSQHDSTGAQKDDGETSSLSGMSDGASSDSEVEEYLKEKAQELARRAKELDVHRPRRGIRTKLSSARSKSSIDRGCCGIDGGDHGAPPGRGGEDGRTGPDGSGSAGGSGGAPGGARRGSAPGDVSAKSRENSLEQGSLTVDQSSISRLTVDESTYSGGGDPPATTDSSTTISVEEVPAKSILPDLLPRKGSTFKDAVHDLKTLLSSTAGENPGRFDNNKSSTYQRSSSGGESGRTRAVPTVAFQRAVLGCKCLKDVERVVGKSFPHLPRRGRRRNPKTGSEQTDKGKLGPKRRRSSEEDPRPPAENPTTAGSPPGDEERNPPSSGNPAPSGENGAGVDKDHELVRPPKRLMCMRTSSSSNLLKVDAFKRGGGLARSTSPSVVDSASEEDVVSDVEEQDDFGSPLNLIMDFVPDATSGTPATVVPPLDLLGTPSFMGRGGDLDDATIGVGDFRDDGGEDQPVLRLSSDTPGSANFLGRISPDDEDCYPSTIDHEDSFLNDSRLSLGCFSTPDARRSSVGSIVGGHGAGGPLLPLPQATKERTSSPVPWANCDNGPFNGGFSLYNNLRGDDDNLFGRTGGSVEVQPGSYSFTEDHLLEGPCSLGGGGACSKSLSQKRLLPIPAAFGGGRGAASSQGTSLFGGRAHSKLLGQNTSAVNSKHRTLGDWLLAVVYLIKFNSPYLKALDLSHLPLWNCLGLVKTLFRALRDTNGTLEELRMSCCGLQGLTSSCTSGLAARTSTTSHAAPGSVATCPIMSRLSLERRETDKNTQLVGPTGIIFSTSNTTAAAQEELLTKNHSGEDQLQEPQPIQAGSEDLAMLLRQTLERNQTLEKLHLDGNAFEARTLEQIALGLSKNSSLDLRRPCEV